MIAAAAAAVAVVAAVAAVAAAVVAAAAVGGVPPQHTYSPTTQAREREKKSPKNSPSRKWMQHFFSKKVAQNINFVNGQRSVATKRPHQKVFCYFNLHVK